MNGIQILSYIYNYMYEINRSNCKVKSNGYNYYRNGINRYGEIRKVYISSGNA